MRNLQILALVRITVRVLRVASITVALTRTVLVTAARAHDVVAVDDIAALAAGGQRRVAPVRPALQCALSVQVVPRMAREAGGCAGVGAAAATDPTILQSGCAALNFGRVVRRTRRRGRPGTATTLLTVD